MFLNLPLWANFYTYTDLSGTSTTLDQPTLLDDHNLNPQVEAEVEAEVDAGWGLAYLAGPYWMTSTQSWGKLRAGVQLDFDLHSEHIIA